MDWNESSYAEIKEALESAPILAKPWQGSDGAAFVEPEWERSFLNRPGGALVYPSAKPTEGAEWLWQIELPGSKQMPTEIGHVSTREAGQAAADAALRRHGVRLPEDG